MSRPPKLTLDQKAALREWEPKLRSAAKAGDLRTAKVATRHIQDILRRTGHETRLMQDKTWLFEAAMEAGEIPFAVSGFTGIRSKVNSRTLAYRKATALLAVCYLRLREIDRAKPYIKEALRDRSYGGTAKRRGDVRVALLRFFQQETILAEMRGKYREHLDVDDIYERAGNLVQARSEAEIFEYAANAVPTRARTSFLDVTACAREALPSAERKLLADPAASAQEAAFGERVVQAVKKVVWRAICDPSSPVHQAWSKKGVMFVAKGKMMIAAVLTCLQQYGLAIGALAVSLAAIIIKMSLEVFCEALPPDWVVDL